MQSAEVSPGFHVSAGAAVIADQERPVSTPDGETIKSQGSDYVVLVTPSYGFRLGVPLEVGLNVGMYGEDLDGASTGCDAINCFGHDQPENGVHAFASPYLKVGAVSDGPARVAAVVGFDGIGVVASFDAGWWDPHLSVKRVFSLGDPLAADVPRVVTRYQQPEISTLAFAVGTGLGRSDFLDIEVGWITSSYRTPVGATRRNDLFVGARITYGAASHGR